MMDKTEKPMNTGKSKQEKAEKPPRRTYQRPRIISHSAEELRKASHAVNACSSFSP